MTRLFVLALGAALIVAGCEEKKTSETPRQEAGASPDKYATADPKLEKALKAVAAASGTPDNGPPPSGIFPPGAADQRHARGVPTKVDFLESGAEPLVALLPAGDASAEGARAITYGSAALQSVIQMGPRVVIGVDYGLLLGPAKKDDGGAEWLVADVKRAVPSKALGPPPAGTDKDIGSLEGTQLRVKLTADGRESELVTRLATSAKADLDRLAQSAAEALVFSTVPLPPKPVGVGAQWIAETRMPLSGLDVIVYRAYRVKSVDRDKVHLTLDAKAYAASSDVQLAGVPPGATLAQFEATCRGEIDVVRGEALARKAEIQQHDVLVFAAPGGDKAADKSGQPPTNMLTAQLQSQAMFLRGDELRAAARQQ
jgi:hypothetical protein